ncbi:chemosensory receptor C [Elysia marginata]|uniref:Chemosensory receptor C n=1 Tax=Elysia marginata TaxID=1093978 RepID=A0AAV4IKW6_9GAST|nr:chemosensory receptor C [Elysia marginata]
METNLSKPTVSDQTPGVDLISGGYPYPYKREFELVASILEPAQFVLLLAGLFSNTVNITVFLRAGVKDSVTTLLLALSISDGLFLTLFTPSTVRSAFSRFGLTSSRELSIVHYLFFWPAFTFYDLSLYISVFLGVTKCSCVAMPLRFKTVFTTKRTVLALCALFCASVLLHLPMLTQFRLGWVKDPKTNTTSLSVVRDFSVQVYKQKLNDIINKNTIPWISFITMVVCVVLLSLKLWESSKLRSLPRDNAPSSETTSDKRPETKQTSTQLHKLSPKDKKVVQSVVLDSNARRRQQPTVLCVTSPKLVRCRPSSLDNVHLSDVPAAHRQVWWTGQWRLLWLPSQSSESRDRQRYPGAASVQFETPLGGQAAISFASDTSFAERKLRTRGSSKGHAASLNLRPLEGGDKPQTVRIKLPKATNALYPK